MSKPDFAAQADELISLLDIPRRVHGTLSSALRDAYTLGLTHVEELLAQWSDEAEDADDNAASEAFDEAVEAVRGMKE